jgi:hypothetical protein
MNEGGHGLLIWLHSGHAAKDEGGTVFTHIGSTPSPDPRVHRGILILYFQKIIRNGIEVGSEGKSG